MIYKLGQPYIEINSQCNLSCVYCYHSERFDNRLSSETLFNIFKQLNLLGATEIKISGGEPLLHPEFETIIRILKKMDFSIELVTNGTMINDLNAKFLASNIDKLVISLDSHDCNTNNLTRPQSYQLVINGIDALKKAGCLNIYVGAVATKKNTDVEGFVNWCERNSIKGIIFESIHREGKAKKIFENYFLEYSDYMIYRQKLLKLKKKSSVEISALPDFGGGCMLVENIPIIRPRIDYDGDVYLCRSFLDKEMSVGNILKDDLKSILENKKTQKIIDELKKRQEKIEKCHKCFISNRICRGGCAAQAYNRTGTLFDIDDLCEWRIRNAIDVVKNVEYEL